MTMIGVIDLARLTYGDPQVIVGEHQ